MRVKVKGDINSEYVMSLVEEALDLWLLPILARVFTGNLYIAIRTVLRERHSISSIISTCHCGSCGTGCRHVELTMSSLVALDVACLDSMGQVV